MATAVVRGLLITVRDERNSHAYVSSAHHLRLSSDGMKVWERVELILSQVVELSTRLRSREMGVSISQCSVQMELQRTIAIKRRRMNAF